MIKYCNMNTEQARNVAVFVFHWSLYKVYKKLLISEHQHDDTGFK